MNISSDKLAQVINCLYSVAQMCSCEDTLTRNWGPQYIDDVLSYNSLTTNVLTWAWKIIVAKPGVWVFQNQL